MITSVLHARVQVDLLFMNYVTKTIIEEQPTAHDYIRNPCFIVSVLKLV